MTVSFCVIAYNEEKALSSLFTDICNQTYPHDRMEIVLVDAMSTDKTRKKMEDFAKQDNDFISVKVVDNPKRNQASGWNIAIRESSGDIVLRIDAHTMIPEDFVTKNVICIESGEYVVGGPRPNIAEENTSWKETLLVAETSMFGSSIAPYRKGHHKTYVKSVFHGAYRREVFDKVGGFNEALGRTEDNEMHFRIRKAGYNICYNPSIVSYQKTRSSWILMIKQKYANGYWIGLTLGICPKCLSIYHLIPGCFVFSIFLSIFLALFKSSVLLVVLALVYGGLDITMSVIAILCAKKKYWQYLMLPLIFFSLHLSYGVGTIIGLLRMPFWKRKKYRKKW